MKKILIADDNYYNLATIHDFLFKYEVEIFPGANDILPFSDLLHDFGAGKINDGLSQIINRIEKENPDIILLDVCLNDAKPYNESGYDIQKAIEGHPVLKEKEIFHLTRHQPRFFGNKNHIPKGPSMEGSLKLKIVDANNLQKKETETDGIIDQLVKNVETGYANDALKEILERLKRDQRDSFKWFADKVDNVYLNKLKIYGDVIITTLFYITLPLLFLAGLALIVKGAIHYDFDPIHIAEYAFVSFLPFLMVFGFFTFYALSLRHYLRGEQVNEDNLELSSRLIMMTKTLFISSLISYVFTKLIEKSELESQYQMIALFGIVIGLALYYIYLNTHNKNH